MTTTKPDEPWTGICINGEGLKTIHHTGEAIRLGPFLCGSASETSGSYTFTTQMEITEEGAAIFDEICGTRTQQEPGEPQVEYKEAEGATWRSAGRVNNIHVNELGPMSGKAWERLGPTRGRCRSDRLRKFVWRRGQLVEVRTRGRAGLRSLRAAIEAAGPPPASFGPLVMKVDLVLKTAVPPVCTKTEYDCGDPRCKVHHPDCSEDSGECWHDARSTKDGSGPKRNAKPETQTPSEEKPDHEPAPNQEDTDGINF